MTICAKYQQEWSAISRPLLKVTPSVLLNALQGIACNPRIPIGRFFSRFTLTNSYSGRNKVLAQGKISESGCASLPCFRRPTAKSPLCGFFYGSDVRERFGAPFSWNAVMHISFVRLTRKCAFSEPEQSIVLGDSAMTETLKLAAKERAAAITLEDALSDIFALVRVTHQLALNQIYEVTHSPYDDDINEALFTSVSLLREKTAAFENHYLLKDVDRGAAA